MRVLMTSLSMLVVLGISGGCSWIKAHEKERQALWEETLHRDDPLPPPGYDADVIIVVPQDSMIYIPNADGGSYGYILGK